MGRCPRPPLGIICSCRERAGLPTELGGLPEGAWRSSQLLSRGRLKFPEDALASSRRLCVSVRSLSQFRLDAPFIKMSGGARSAVRLYSLALRGLDHCRVY